METLKDRFLDAVANGHLGTTGDSGTIVTLRQFRSYFDDIKSKYVSSFLPASVIEPGQLQPTHNKFLFRIDKGIYRVHQDAIDHHGQAGIGNPNNRNQASTVE